MPGGAHVLQVLTEERVQRGVLRVLDAVLVAQRSDEPHHEGVQVAEPDFGFVAFDGVARRRGRRSEVPVR